MIGFILAFVLWTAEAAEVDLNACLAGSGIITDTPELACVVNTPPPPVTCTETWFDTFDTFNAWTSWTAEGSVAGVDNGHYGMADPWGRWAFAWLTAEFPADTYAEVVISDSIAPYMIQQIFVRRQSDTLARYGVHWFSNTWEMKYDGVVSSSTDIIATLVGPGPQPGDVLRLEVVGSELTFYVNGVELMSGTDNRITQGGQSGLIGINMNGTSAPRVFHPVANSFSAGVCG